MLTDQLLIPVKKCRAHSGVLPLPDHITLSGRDPDDDFALGLLARDLSGLGLEAAVCRGARKATVRMVRSRSLTQPEGYRLEVTPAGVTVTSRTAAGGYYGIATLRELIRLQGKNLGGCAIEDWPDFARRGIYHDCSRGKVPKLQTLLDLVDRLAAWKLNELELYVENVFTFRRHPDIGRGYSPFTPQEMLALQVHCRKHHVRLVGSLASFGHMEKILQLPKYAKLGELPGFQGLPGGTTLCPTDPGSFRLVKDLFEEFVPLHEAKDFNVCGDEPWELGKGRSHWKVCQVGMGPVYLDFMLQIHRLCQRLGKRMNAWADIVLDHPRLLGSWPKDVVMLNWEYHPTGRRIKRTQEIVDAGLPTVVCPGTNTWGAHGCRLRMGMENIANFAAEGLRLQVEGLLNTDWGDNGHRNMLATSLHNFAWGAAHSWHHRGTTDQGFTARFCRQALPDLPAGRLAKAIRLLGSGAEMLHLPYANGSPLYSIFCPPVQWMYESDIAAAMQLEKIPAACIRAYAAALAGLDWPSPGPEADDFTRQMVAEFELATQMELLSCRRALYLQTVQQGRKPTPGDRRELRDYTRVMLELLPMVWKLGNKPSRLGEILAGLRRLLKEYQ